VVGDVQRSGAYNLGGQRTLSVLSALSMAGGLGHTAKPEHALIFRPASDGQKHQEIAVNIRQILKGKAEDLALRPDDVLVVPTSSSKVFGVIVTGTLASAVGAAIYGGTAH
jgi:protein involved in polysaccharide export with SLBB domain